MKLKYHKECTLLILSSVLKEDDEIIYLDSALKESLNTLLKIKELQLSILKSRYNSTLLSLSPALKDVDTIIYLDSALNEYLNSLLKIKELQLSRLK